jgi:hypothetical protein
MRRSNLMSNNGLTFKATWIKDQPAIRSTRSQLNKVVKTLVKYEGRPFCSNQMGLIDAKEFTRLLQVKLRLDNQLSDQLESKDMLKIQMFSTSVGLPSGFEEFTISASGWSNDSVRINSKNEDSTVRAHLREFVKAYRSPDRSIHIVSKHPVCPFCLISENSSGIVRLYLPS